MRALASECEPSAAVDVQRTPLLAVRGLTKSYRMGAETVPALNGIDPSVVAARVSAAEILH
jgi:hypothetical protein